MKTIITIGREFGSGGHEIGEKLAKKLNVPFYDKNILQLAAKESGLCEELFENHDERPTSSFLYNLVMDTYSFGYSTSTYVDMPISHKVFLAQFDTIKKVAEEGPCVIIGRCADYALADYDNCINIFIHSNMDSKINRIMERYSVTKEKAKDMCIKNDKQRANYYNYYSSKKWGRVESYNLTVDSSILGTDGTVELITQFINDYENK